MMPKWWLYRLCQNKWQNLLRYSKQQCRWYKGTVMYFCLIGNFPFTSAGLHFKCGFTALHWEAYNKKRHISRRSICWIFLKVVLQKIPLCMISIRINCEDYQCTSCLFYHKFCKFFLAGLNRSPGENTILLWEDQEAIVPVPAPVLPLSFYSAFVCLRHYIYVPADHGSGMFQRMLIEACRFAGFGNTFIADFS